ncbi:MAG TPA: hypothetical protein PLH87_13255 [Bacillota bacterium]|jgi:hypothetical protein|nr:hypothetical protein [Bacillota bacterium]
MADKKPKKKKALEYTAVEQPKPTVKTQAENAELKEPINLGYPFLKFDQENLIQGIILGEILNAPRCRRRLR